MKQTMRVLTAILLILLYVVFAVGSGNYGDRSPKQQTGAAEEPAKEEKETEDPRVGVYTGSSDETHYWDNGAQKQREKSFYVYKRGTFYYVTTAVSSIQEVGAEAYFESVYINGNREIDSSYTNSSGNEARFVDICHLNEVQYISTTYEITFGENGKITILWNGTTTYGDDAPEPYETGVFIGTKT